MPRRRLGRVRPVLPVPLRARRRRRSEPCADRRGPQRRRHAPGLRHRRAAERPPRLHGRGRGQVPRDHAEALSARADPGHHEPSDRARRGAGLRPELRDRPRQRDPLVPDHRLHRPAAQGRYRGRKRRDQGSTPSTRQGPRAPSSPTGHARRFARRADADSATSAMLAPRGHGSRPRRADRRPISAPASPLLGAVATRPPVYGVFSLARSRLRGADDAPVDRGISSLSSSRPTDIVIFERIKEEVRGANRCAPPRPATQCFARSSTRRVR